MKTLALNERRKEQQEKREKSYSELIEEIEKLTSQKK